MYSQLYAAWQREIDDPTLGVLPPDFYVKLGDYLLSIKNEDKVLDKKSVKMNLLVHESSNVERMLKELLETRYRKLIKTVTKNQKAPVGLLTDEEAKMIETFSDFTKTYKKFAEDLMQGQIDKIKEADENPRKVVVKTDTTTHLAPKRSTIRFVRSIPAIMGADMKSYGPFTAEDVASLPSQNAQILVKQGLAVLVEVS